LNYLSNKNILITGSTGFIGSSLVNALSNSCNKLILLSRTINPEIPHKQIKCDFLTDELKIDFFQNVDVVFHLAGCAHDTRISKSENYYRKINVEASLNIAQLAIKCNVSKFVYLSSVKAGPKINQNKFFSQGDIKAKDIYGQTKYEAEEALMQIALMCNMSLIILRPALVYGPEVKGNLKFMLKGVLQGWFPPLPEVHKYRSMVHIDDLIRALMFIVEDNRADGNTYVITDEHKYSSREIYETLCYACNKKPFNWSVPKFVFELIGYLHPVIRSKMRKLFDDEIYSSVKIKELGFNPIKSLKDINETIF
tara:strand:- start:2871 stop:3800 length:930 start_codon:yes stop_codon:yes gene_type:complete